MNIQQKTLILGIVILLLGGLTFPLQGAENEVATHALKMNLEKFEQYRQSDREKALGYAQLVVEALDSTASGVQVASIYRFLSENCEFHTYRYSEALDHKLHEAEILRQANDRYGIARTEADLGRICLKKGDYHKAYNHALEAMRTAEKLEDTLTMREAEITIEQVEFFYYNDEERALAHNQRISEHFEGAEQARQAVRAINNRFRYSLTPEQLKELMTRSEAICARYELQDMMINLYLNAALQELRFNDTEACSHYLKLAKPLISDFKEEGYYYSTAGFYHLYLGNNDQAIADTKRSIELLEQGDFESKNVHSYFLLQELYRSRGDYPEAYEALREFAETYTRQHNNETIVELSQLINELELSHAEAQHKRDRQLNTLVLLILVLGVIILITGISLFYTKVKLERKNRRLMAEQAEQELRNKNEMIKIQKLQQFQEQRNLAQITEELTSAVKSGGDKEMRSELKRIIRHLQKSSDTSADWVEVEKTLVVNNDIFYENLLREYPNLTKNERKLCTFIHLNLSTKEISKITHQSMGSIHIARSRLRQKFGITGSDQSLIAFLDRFKSSEKGA